MTNNLLGITNTHSNRKRKALVLPLFCFITLLYTLTTSSMSRASSILAYNNRPAVVLTEKQTQQIEEKWAHCLQKHTEELEAAFKKYSPRDYSGFKQFKKTKWKPSFNKDHNQVYSCWFALSDRWSLKYARLHELFIAWANLNSASIYMERYFLYGKASDFQQFEKKLHKVLAAFSKEPRSHPKARKTTINLFIWNYT